VLRRSRATTAPATSPWWSSRRRRGSGIAEVTGSGEQLHRQPVDFEAFARAVADAGLYWLLLNHRRVTALRSDRRGLTADAELICARCGRGLRAAAPARGHRGDMRAALERQPWTSSERLRDARVRCPGRARALKERSPGVPFIVCRAVGEDTAVAAMKAGARLRMKDRLQRLARP